MKSNWKNKHKSAELRKGAKSDHILREKETGGLSYLEMANFL